MADLDITQDEADTLIAMEKQRTDDRAWAFDPGARMSIPLASADKREICLLDVSRFQIKISKATYQNRARQTLILMRLDIDGPPHRNPDGEEIPCPHLHIYKEGRIWRQVGYTSPFDPVSRYDRSVWNVCRIHGALQCYRATILSSGAVLMNNTAAEIQNLLDSYLLWLRDKTTLREVNGSWVEITTPYLDRHNDALQIYARRQNGGMLLSDDSYIIRDLEMSGCKLDTGKRQDLLRMTLNGFGVKLNKEALEIHATAENFPLRKHNLIQAMLAVNDLFYLAQPFVASLFLEDVISWLDENDVRYTPRVKFTGISGYDHLFDFVIPKSRKQPERIVQAINRPTRDTAESFMHKWSDTREVRSSDSKAYAFLNDREQAIPSGVLDAFKNYAIHPVPWSHRAEVVTELAA
ncbi:MAG: DUF1829 domain-containing protein [Bryobacteraceae bacterium]|nr:DUF1829 domain-containing protein [Bryobacteraceae bacterium]